MEAEAWIERLRLECFRISQAKLSVAIGCSATPSSGAARLRSGSACVHRGWGARPSRAAGLFPSINNRAALMRRAE